ncbi:alpha/beta hydrolase [Achromobacter pestifer]
MPLHPDIEAFLELVQAGRDQGRPPMHQMSAGQARQDYDHSARMLDSCPADLDDVRDLEIPVRDGARIGARLYRQADAAGAVLLYFHGGGYCVGGLDSHDSLCRDLALRSGCAVLAVAYRLAPEHRFPTAFEDAVDSYAWLRGQAPVLGLNAGHIAVGGDSAGATLATALCLALRDAGQPQPLLQALLYPCTSARQDSASHQRYAEGHLLEGDTLQWMFNNYLRGDADRTDWRFAPLEAADLRGLAPALVALPEYDPLHDEGLAYAQRLRAAGVPVDIRVYPGMIHDFARLADVAPDTGQVRADVARALHFARIQA